MKLDTTTPARVVVLFPQSGLSALLVLHLSILSYIFLLNTILYNYAVLKFRCINTKQIGKSQNLYRRVGAGRMQCAIKGGILRLL